MSNKTQKESPKGQSKAPRKPSRTWSKAPRDSEGKPIPNPVDVYVGKRLRQRRTLLGMSQTVLGDAVGLTFQQIQKYERGANRMGASRLFDIANVLDVPISYFFEDMSREVANQRPSRLMGLPSEMVERAVETRTDLPGDPMNRRETTDLVRVYYKIEDPAVRKRFYSLIKATAAALKKNRG